MKTISLSTLTLISLFLSSASAFAGQITIKNCGHKAVTVVAYNDNDKTLLVGTSSVRLALGETKTLQCKTATCKLRVGGFLAQPSYKTPPFNIYWPHSNRLPEFRSFCRPESPQKKGILQVKNCGTHAFTVKAFNGNDDSWGIAASQAFLQPNEVKTLTCATKLCYLKVDEFRLHKSSGAVRIQRLAKWRPTLFSGHTCTQNR